MVDHAIHLTILHYCTTQFSSNYRKERQANTSECLCRASLSNASIAALSHHWQCSVDKNWKPWVGRVMLEFRHTVLFDWAACTSVTLAWDVDHTGQQYFTS